jgi:hypothetical protein
MTSIIGCRVYSLPMEDVEDLACILGCKMYSLPMIYLGLSLGDSFKAKSIWEGIIERMECYLVG